jgi:hypothetical protein
MMRIRDNTPCLTTRVGDETAPPPKGGSAKRQVYGNTRRHDGCAPERPLLFLCHQSTAAGEEKGAEVVRRISLSAMICVLALLVLAMPASASVRWCRTDPVVDFNGMTTNTYVSTYAEALHGAVTGPTKVVYRLPSGVKSRLRYTDNGFGYGYDVVFEYDKRMKVNPDGTIPVEILVHVPAGKPMPIIVEWEPVSVGAVTASAKGTTNKWITVRGTVQ